MDLAALNAWLVQAEYDDDLSREGRDILAGVRLVAIEAGENLCSEAEVRKEISATLRVPASRARRLPA